MDPNQRPRPPPLAQPPHPPPTPCPVYLFFTRVELVPGVVAALVCAVHGTDRAPLSASGCTLWTGFVPCAQSLTPSTCSDACRTGMNSPRCVAVWS